MMGSVLLNPQQFCSGRGAAINSTTNYMTLIIEELRLRSMSNIRLLATMDRHVTQHKPQGRVSHVHKGDTRVQIVREDKRKGG